MWNSDLVLKSPKLKSSPVAQNKFLQLFSFNCWLLKLIYTNYWLIYYDVKTWIIVKTQPNINLTYVRLSLRLNVWQNSLLVLKAKEKNQAQNQDEHSPCRILGFPEKLSLKSELAQESSRDFPNIISADFLELLVHRFVSSSIMLLKHVWNTDISETMVLDDENLVYS